MNSYSFFKIITCFVEIMQNVFINNCLQSTLKICVSNLKQCVNKMPFFAELSCQYFFALL